MEALQEQYGQRLFAYMSKPTHPTDLIEAVRRAIKTSEQAQLGALGARYWIVIRSVFLPSKRRFCCVRTASNHNRRRGRGGRSLPPPWSWRSVGLCVKHLAPVPRRGGCALEAI